MTQDKNCGTALGLLFIIVPILALLFGNEPALQTDSAALVMTAMIIIGVITIVNSRNKQAVSQPTQVHTQVPTQSTTDTQARHTSGFCPYCGAQVAASDGRYCASCGKELPTH